MLRDRNEVEDVLQTVLANAYRDFHLYAEGTNFRAWVFRYLNLEIFGRNRKAGRRRHETLYSEVPVEETWELALSEPAFDKLLEFPETVLEACDEILAEAVRDLAPLDRAVLLLRAIGEFKYREMAEILEVPIGTVMSSLARSRQRLRHRLVEHCGRSGLLRHGG